MKEVSVAVQQDHLESLARSTRPLVGIAELIWNALDADAMLVSVVFERNLLGGLDRILVIDDGHGISPDTVESSYYRKLWIAVDGMKKAAYPSA